MDEINIVELFALIKKRKSFIIIFTLVISICAAVISIFMPNIYRSQVVILPLAHKSGFSLGGALGGLVQSMGGGSVSGQNTELIAILKSRSLAEEVVSKNGFEKTLFNPPVSVQTAALKIRLELKVIEDAALNTLTIQIDNVDPEHAAQLVNAYIEALESKILVNTFTKAKKNRIFIEQQLNRNRVLLLESGKVLSSLYETEGVSDSLPYKDIPIGQEDEFISTNSEKKATSALETQIVKSVPDKVYIDYLMLNRQMLFQVNGLLLQQYEMAKIDESKEDLGFQVLDKAQVPKFKIKPIRTRIIMISFIVGFFGAMFIVFVYEYISENSRLYNLKKLN